MTLSELLNERSEIENMLIESEGEITPEIAERLDANETDTRAKVDGYHAIIAKMTYGDAEIDAEIKRLQALKKAKANAVKNLKDHLLYNMQQTGETCLEGTTCKVFRQNTGENLVIEDESTLLSAYEFALEVVRQSAPAWVKYSVAVDKTALKTAIKGGDEVGGCSLQRSEFVRFR